MCTEVRGGDVVVMPYGYHGPSVAAPGYDLYYLNVMAGPAEDSVWLMTDDPHHTWVRQTWEGPGGRPAPAHDPHERLADPPFDRPTT